MAMSERGGGCGGGEAVGKGGESKSWMSGMRTKILVRKFIIVE